MDDVATEPCVNCADYERLAAERLDAGALAYYAGGAGDENTLRENVAAWSRRRLRPRVLVDVSEVTTATTVLGTEIATPVLVAPTALQRMAHPDGEPGMARAAAAAGTIMVLSTLATSNAAEVAEAAPGAPRWYQLYVAKDRSVSQTLIDAAVDAGFTAIVVTVDAPVPGRRERDLRAAFRVPMELDDAGGERRDRAQRRRHGRGLLLARSIRASPGRISSGSSTTARCRCSSRASRPARTPRCAASTARPA